MTTTAKLLAAALAATLLLPPTPVRADETVTIGIAGAVSDIIPFLAKKKGYLHDEGLDANLINFDSGAKMVAPLGAGQLDVGAGSWSAGLFNAVARGISIKIVADKATNEAPYDYRVVLVRKPLAGTIKSFTDLKGRKVGVVAQGAADDSSVNDAMTSVGLKFGDVDIQYMGFSSQIVALSNGGIDAAFSSEPDATLAVRQGIAVKFMPYSSFYPVQESGIILFGTNFIEKHHETAQKFMRAYIRAARFYDDSLTGGHIAGPGADYIFAALGELTKQPDLSVFHDMTPSWCNPDGTLSMKSLAKDLAFFKASGEVKADITPEQVTDSSFVEQALKELGPYRPHTN
jgi:NitT/TauT family transport system substrate-binding protein